MFFWVWHSKAVLQTWRCGRVEFGHGIDTASRWSISFAIGFLAGLELFELSME